MNFILINRRHIANQGPQEGNKQRWAAVLENVSNNDINKLIIWGKIGINDTIGSAQKIGSMKRKKQQKKNYANEAIQLVSNRPIKSVGTIQSHDTKIGPENRRLYRPIQSEDRIGIRRSFNWIFCPLLPSLQR